MEEIVIEAEELVTAIAAPRGITKANIEMQLRDEMRCGQGYRMIVRGKRAYYVPLESIKLYFGITEKPEEQAAPVVKQALDKMVDFGEEEPKPAKETKKRDVK